MGILDQERPAETPVSLLVLTSRGWNRARTPGQAKGNSRFRQKVQKVVIPGDSARKCDSWRFW